jgi:hypothetical protein
MDRSVGLLKMSIMTKVPGTTSWSSSRGVDPRFKVSYAAPRHQEQKGISKSNWKNVRNLAFPCLSEAQMDMSFFHCAFEQAWKIHSVLPYKALTKTDGTFECPFSVYTGEPVFVSSFRVMFCPVIMTYDNIIISQNNPRTGRSAALHRQPRLETSNRKTVHKEECEVSLSVHLATRQAILFLSPIQEGFTTRQTSTLMRASIRPVFLGFLSMSHSCLHDRKFVYICTYLRM